MTETSPLLSPSLEALEAFILKAKSACAMGAGKQLQPSRPGATDYDYHAGPFSYHSSSFGKKDLIGQEVVFYGSTAVWGANHYAKLLDPQRLPLAEAQKVVRHSLSAMYYQENRFLGNFSYDVDGYTYEDENSGDVRMFQGMETISQGERLLYRLFYHGGLIKSPFW